MKIRTDTYRHADGDDATVEVLSTMVIIRSERLRGGSCAAHLDQMVAVLAAHGYQTAPFDPTSPA